jgi:lysophospholipase L1-like esterase
MHRNKTVVACLGSSSTAAKGSYDWIRELRLRPGNRTVAFHNFGVGGDLAYNALRRLPSVVATRPDKVVVLVGGNDVLALISDEARRVFRWWKHLPHDPSPDWYRENMLAIVHGLKQATATDVALCSLAPIGEAPHADSPFQSEVNRRIEEYSGIVQHVSRAEQVTYLPFYEQMHELIVAEPGRAFTEFRFLPFYRDAFRILVLRQSLDDVGRRNGYRFHTDGVHLNSRSGILLANLVQRFIDR